jgi:hypothetical protein
MLDVNTPKGEAATAAERAMMLRFAAEHKAEIAETPKKYDGIIDGFVVEVPSYEIRFGYEAKTRNASLEDLRKWGSYLITAEKLDRGAALCAELRVHFCLLVSLEKDGSAIIYHVSDRHGNFVFDFDRRATITQATVNGGTANRVNAFLPFEHATVLWHGT